MPLPPPDILMAWAPLLLAMLVAGVASGFIAGLLGAGGGMVLVPALFHVFEAMGVPLDVRMHVSVGTALALIILNAISSTRAHHRRGGVDAALLRQWAAPVMLGALAGAAAAGAARGAILTTAFIAFALIISARLAMPPAPPKGESQAGRSGPHAAGWWMRLAAPFGIGGLSSALGIGGGTFTVPTLAGRGWPMRRAVGTAAAVGLFISAPGAAGFIVTGWGAADLPPLSIGYVNLAGVAIVAPASMLAAPWGARAAHWLPPLVLRRVFAAFLLLMGLRMLYAMLAG